MKKTLVTLALAAVPALILSACNGGAGGSSGINPSVPSAPGATHQGRVHHMDNGPQDLHAGGATFPAYGYNLGNQPVGSYNGPQTPPGNGSLFYSYGGVGTIYYCLTGSGFGRKEFEANNGTATVACQPLGASPSGFGGRQDPLDFVGSDVAMPSTECCASGTTYYNGRISTSPSWGQPFEIPTIGGPIVYGFRPQDFSVSTIKLSTWTYCAIANGTVYNWNDPAITADNGGTSVTGGTNETITFYFRSDSSGTTDIFTNHLNTVCGSSWAAPYNAPPYQSAGRSAAWGYGVSMVWPGPSGTGPNGNPFIGESGNPGVLAGIQSTPFSTGYLEGAWAKSANPKVGQAWLQNGYNKKLHEAIMVNPTNKSAVAKALAGVTSSAIDYGVGSDGNSLGSTTPWCQLYIPLSNVATPPNKTYPIVGFSYWLFYGNNNGVHLSDKKKLINFLVSSSASTIISKLEYAPLSSSVHTAITNALNGNGGSQPACLQ
jgi:ABC-type phosphate transport system substrate-binding protein